jgi:hypothetical protein
MWETLYKTNPPKDFHDGEYYQPQLDFEFEGEKTAYFVREKHGYFSDEEKRPVNVTTTLSPEEGYSTYEAALARYEEQVRHRAKSGFVHSFHFDPFATNGVGYRYRG